MVIDTSALLAILFREAEADTFLNAINSDSIRLISVASVLEAAIVLQRRSSDKGTIELDALIAGLPAETVATDLEQLRWARYAFETFGGGGIPPASTSAIAFPTPWAKQPANHCSSKAATSRRRISPRLYCEP